MCKEIKPIIGQVFGFSQELITKEDELKELQKKYDTLNTSLQEALSDDMTDKTKINTLQEIIDSYKKNTELADHWNNKYPKANIEYTGRTWGPTKKMIPIDVRLLVTPQDYHIHEILAANNLYIKDGNYEEGIPKIYNFIRTKFYSYVFDENNFGIPEFWEFPFEILEGFAIKATTGFDCDSWASFLASFYIAAGVPEWKVKVVVGDCVLGGHSTDYIHSDLTNKYHHLNSTYGNKALTKISEYPTTDEAGEGKSDRLGIYDVWLSYNNLYAWHEFKSYASKDAFNKKAKYLFKIHRIK